jgi:hypothetical protein
MSAPQKPSKAELLRASIEIRDVIRRLEEVLTVVTPDNPPPPPQRRRGDGDK